MSSEESGSGSPQDKNAAVYNARSGVVSFQETVEMELKSTLVWWKVRCLNRKDRTFFDRTLLLDPSSLSPEEQSRLLRLIEHSPTHPGIRAFRDKFHEVTEEELARRAQTATAPTTCLAEPEGTLTEAPFMELKRMADDA